MARKITTAVIEAFTTGKPFSRENSSVELSPLGHMVVMKLHGHAIARYDREKGLQASLEVTSAGYETNTTKERLNGIPGVRVNQKAFCWFLNGKEWENSNSWTFVK